MRLNYYNMLACPFVSYTNVYVTYSDNDDDDDVDNYNKTQVHKTFLSDAIFFEDFVERWIRLVFALVP